MKVFFKVLRVIPCLLFFIQTISAQTLSVSSSQLNFGNVFDNSPDSLQLTISNPIGRDVTVTGIRFYNTYGSPAFSVSSSFFTIPNGSSQMIWVKFSPRHNILHNSEMIIENNGLRGDVSVDLIGQGKYSDTYYNLTENISEENLKSVINVITGNGYVSLGYNDARDEMFMDIDNKKFNGQGATQNTIECVYTGREAVGYADRTDCQTTYSFNTEHTFPQGFFGSSEPMKSDLHHLFPTDDAANNERGSNPFGVVTNGGWTVGGSKSDGSAFEPRDEQKGIVARAMFYFVLRYENYTGFLTSQENILRSWHHSFLPDAIERTRNADINSIQHNKNPFVDYPVLLDRITSVSSTSAAPLISSIDLPQDTINFGTIATGVTVTYTYNIVNTGNTNIQLSGFNLTHSPELSFLNPTNDTVLAPGEALEIFINSDLSIADSVRGFLTYNTNATGNTLVTVPVFVNDIIFNHVDEVFSDVNVYPNPAEDFVRIHSKQFTDDINYRIFNLNGQLIYTDIISGGETVVDIKDLTPGVYLLRIEKSNAVRNIKLIVE